MSDEESMRAMMEALGELGERLKDALPQTSEEWEEVFWRLHREHQELRRAAERVLVVALPPGSCKPTSKKEDGTYRKIVATAALDELSRALYGE